MLLSEKDGRIIFYIKVTANAGHTGIVGMTRVHDKPAFKVQVKTAREGGKANQALIVYFAEIFKTQKRNVMIDAGETQTFKKMMILNMSLEEAKNYFKQLGFFV